MKITMLGISGSGKTTYIAALYQVLCENRIGNFYFTPAAESFHDSIRKIGDFSKISFSKTKYLFPPGTMRTQLWSLDLFYRNALVCNFDWIDYRGGILNISNTSLELVDKELDAIMGHILLSNSILIFVDSLIITYFDDINICKDKTGANNFMHILRSYSRYYPKRKINITIVLTKSNSDLIKEEWKSNNHLLLMRKTVIVFREILSLIKENKDRWSGGVVASDSIGEGKVKSELKKPPNIFEPLFIDTRIIESPNPYNVEHVLFYSIGNTLEKMSKLTENILSEYQIEIQSALKKSNLFNSFWSWVTDKKCNSEIAREILLKYNNEMDKLYRIKPYVKPLYNIALTKIRTV